MRDLWLNRGSGLLLILAVCGIIAIFTGAVGLGAVGNLKSMSNESQDDQARFIATAGVQAALARLSEPRSWPTADSPSAQGNVWSCVDYNYEEDHLGLWSTTNPNLHAQVLVYNNTSEAFHRTPQGPDQIDIPSGRVLIISTGIVDGDDRGSRQSTTVAALAKSAGVSFDEAAFGNSKVQIQGTRIDSVDSRAAGWTPASYAPYDLNVASTKNATVASNNHRHDSVTFDSSSEVDGNVYSGPNSTMGAIGYYGATVTGSDGTLASLKELNNLLPPTDAAELGNGGITYGAGVTTLPAGTYKVAGDLNFLSGSELNVTGPTILYVEGNVSATGAKLNITGNPSNLQIYVTGGSSSSVTLDSIESSALLSAPESEVSLTNSEHFGAVIAERFQANSSQLHYDIAVRGVPQGSSAWVYDSFINRATTKQLAVTPPAGGPPADPGPGGTSAGGTSAGGTSAGGTSGAEPPSQPPGGTSGGSSGGPYEPETPRCCRDYSCGPPRCMLF